MSVTNQPHIYNQGMTDADVQAIIDATPNIKNVQSDWNENDSTKDSFVKNRPVKTGLSYYSTSGDDCFLILRKTIRTTSSHVEQFSLNIRYSRSPSLCITSELNILLLVNKNQQTITFPVFINNIFANSSKNIPEWEILAEADFNIGVFSLYAKRVSGNYSTIEYMLTSASSERYDYIEDVNVYSITPSETPSTYVTAQNRYNVYSSNLNNIDLDGIMTDDNGDQMTEAPPQQVYVTGKFYFVMGKVCRCTAYSASSATFDVYGVVEALNYVLSQT